MFAQLKKLLKKTPLYYPMRFVYKIVRRPLIQKLVEFPTQPYVFSKEEARRVYTIILSGKLHHRTGHEVSMLEKEFAVYHGVQYALATNAGTSALEMAIKAIGIKPGDEVIVPAYTFIATAQAVLARGGIPVFADIDDTFTISPLSVAKRISSRTKAIVAVHMFGNVADMDQINRIAKQRKLFVVEDCCQAIGATFKEKKVGSLGDIGCFSFNEKKAITTGQGGMFITNNKDFFTIANHTRETGQLDDLLASDVITTGNTFALTEMQASLARSELVRLDQLNDVRMKNYDIFSSMIDTDFVPLRWYRILPQAHPSFSRLVFMIDFEFLRVSRNDFIKAMNHKGIPMRTFYPIPLYAYTLFQKRRDTLLDSSFPFALNSRVRYSKLHLPYVETFCRQQVGIEFSPYITEEHLSFMCSVLSNYLFSHL